MCPYATTELEIINVERDDTTARQNLSWKYNRELIIEPEVDMRDLITALDVYIEEISAPIKMI